MPLHPAILAADRAPKGLECCAPEHYRDALSMERDERGDLVVSITESVRSALVPRPAKPAPVGLQRQRF